MVGSFQQAVRAVASSRMYDMFAMYLESRLELSLQQAAREAASGNAGPEASTSSKAQQQPRKRGRPAKVQDTPAAGAATAAAAAAGAELLSLYRTAHDASCASPDLYLRWVRLAERLGQAKMARAAARQACGRHPCSLELWACRLRLDAPAPPPVGATPLQPAAVSELLSTLQAAAAAVPVGESAVLWLLVLSSVGGDAAGLGRLVDMLELAVTKAPSGPSRGADGGGLGPVVAAVLQGIRWARVGADGGGLGPVVAAVLQGIRSARVGKGVWATRLAGHQASQGGRGSAGPLCLNMNWD